MNIADRIQSLRKQKGMSQIELADAIGVSRQAVSKWESEQAIPDLDKIIAMSEIFGTTTDYLLKGIEPIEGDPDAPVAPKPKMSKEESLALAEKLTHEYKALEKLRTQISDNETIIKRPVDGSYAQHAAFKFFWPFLIYAVIALNVFYFLAQISSSDGTVLTFLFLALASPVGLLIFGGVTSVRKRDALNQSALEAAQNRRKHMDDLKKETSILETKRSQKAKELKEYDYLVPATLRNSSSMAKAALILRSNKAEDFNQAIDMIHRV